MQFASRFRSHLETAALGLRDPLRLVLDGADREFSLAGNVDQREPIVGGVVLRRCKPVRRDSGGQRQLLAAPSRDLRGIDQPVAPCPDPVVDVRQIRQHIPASIVSDDHLAELRPQIVGFGDYPHPCLGTIGSAHHAADVVGVDRNARFLRAQRHRRQQHGTGSQRCQGEGGSAHLYPPQGHDRGLTSLNTGSGSSPTCRAAS